MTNERSFRLYLPYSSAPVQLDPAIYPPQPRVRYFIFRVSYDNYYYNNYDNNNNVIMTLYDIIIIMIFVTKHKYPGRAHINPTTNQSY